MHNDALVHPSLNALNESNHKRYEISMNNSIIFERGSVIFYKLGIKRIQSN